MRSIREPCSCPASLRGRRGWEDSGDSRAELAFDVRAGTTMLHPVVAALGGTESVIEEDDKHRGYDPCSEDPHLTPALAL
jgi:hypothetical protein